MGGSFGKLLKNLGPGLLFASMAIGTSHLVLSTKAGAQYGWLMIIPILLANLLKYPFFEFGVRYTNSTGKSLIEGYKIRGKSFLYLYGLITLVSTFTILAALYVVTAGLFLNIIGLENSSIGQVSLGLFICIGVLLILGRYWFLEQSLKILITVLFLALLVTTTVVLFKGVTPTPSHFIRPAFFDEAGTLFLIGLIGWMPTAVEASGWVSLWTIEKQQLLGEKPALKSALAEFNLGYWITALLAIFFLIIGWFTLYGTGTILSDSAVSFADQLVQLFTNHIGEWTYPFIAAAAFATMFSTCMTAHDALARVSVDVLAKILPEKETLGTKKPYSIAIVLLALINYLVIQYFGAHMGQLVALATFVSFVMAPIIGYMNLRNMKGQEVPQQNRPGKGLQGLTYLGIVFLSLFALYYCYIVLLES